MATLWHVGDVIELICEFDDSPTHLTTLRRVSWSFHRAVENVWTLLLGRQNSVIADEQLNSIAQRYGDSHLCSEQEGIRQVRAVRAALTVLRHTLTSFVLPCQWPTELELVAQLVDMPQLQSVRLLQKESVLELTAQFGTAAQLEALVHRCPHLLVNSSGNSSLIFTARSGNLGCALVLLQHGCDINAKAVNGNMIAHVACEHGHHEYLEGLIDAGYDVDLNVRTGMFGTPAHMAVHHPSTLQFLVDRGANVDLVSAGLYSGTPAFVAASVGAAESLRILLATGAVLNGTYIPLVLAAWEHPACLDVLGNAGVDLDVVNCAGETAAHHAARDGQLGSLRTLHRHGANMFAVSRAGQTAEQLAALGGFTESVDFFAELRISTRPEHQHSS
jgi:ankyrin repeat protein